MLYYLHKDNTIRGHSVFSFAPLYYNFGPLYQNIHTYYQQMPKKTLKIQVYVICVYISRTLQLHLKLKKPLIFQVKLL